MKEILTRLINHENLDKKESKEILIDISNGIYNHEQVASFLTVFMLRGTSTNELIGFRDQQSGGGGMFGQWVVVLEVF